MCQLVPCIIVFTWLCGVGRRLKWSPAPRPRTSVTTSPASWVSSLLKDSACLSKYLIKVRSGIVGNAGMTLVQQEADLCGLKISQADFFLTHTCSCAHACGLLRLSNMAGIMYRVRSTLQRSSLRSVSQGRCLM